MAEGGFDTLGYFELSLRLVTGILRGFGRAPVVFPSVSISCDFSLSILSWLNSECAC